MNPRPPIDRGWQPCFKMSWRYTLPRMSCPQNDNFDKTITLVCNHGFNNLEAVTFKSNNFGDHLVFSPASSQTRNHVIPLLTANY